MAKNQNQQEKQSILTMDVEDLFKKKNTSANRSKKGMAAVKHTMNFARHESEFNAKKMIPMALLLILVLLVVAKFGFMDPLAEKTAAYNNLAAKQEQLTSVQARLVEYDELAKQYGRYSYGLMNDSEINLVNRMDVLQLVEKEIASKAFVDNFSVNNNVLTMNIYGITLEEASTIVHRLENTDLVTRASVNSASANDGVEARIFISITMEKVEKEAE